MPVFPSSQNGHDLYMEYVAYLIRNHRTDDALDVIDQGRAETLAEGLGLGKKMVHPSSLFAYHSGRWRASPMPSSLSMLCLRSFLLVGGERQRVRLLHASGSRHDSRRRWQATAARYSQPETLWPNSIPRRATLYEMLVKPAEHLIHPAIASSSSQADSMA